MEQLNVRLTGIRPLIMHNGQLADPMNSFAKELKAITSRKKKTDEDHADSRAAEWRGGLYLDAQGRPCITEDMALAAVIHGARKRKLGKQAGAGVPSCTELTFPLIYDGPKDLTKLYADERFVDVRGVKVQASRVQRCRPIFPQWSADISYCVNLELIDAADVVAALEDAGASVGIGDYRPRFGRFTVEVL